MRAFQRMSTYYDRMNKTRSKAIGALIYPTFLLMVAVGVILVIMTFAVPTFASTFSSMDLELPLTTRIVIGLSDFFSKYIWVILALGAGGLFALRLYAATEKGRVHMARARLTLPILGKVALMTAASQFSHTMSAMLSAGMPILKALDTASRSVSNAYLSQQIGDTIPGVESGQSLGECMRQCPDLPPMLVNMTAMGEATGTLESVLEIQAEFYDNEVDVLSARALALLTRYLRVRFLWSSFCCPSICPCSSCTTPFDWKKTFKGGTPRLLTDTVLHPLPERRRESIRRSQYESEREIAEENEALRRLHPHRDAHRGGHHRHPGDRSPSPWSVPAWTRQSRLPMMPTSGLPRLRL